MTVRVLLADDQRVVREGLGTLLGLLDGIELVASAHGAEAVELARRHDPERNRIFAKAGVRDRARAVVYAYEKGLATSTRER